jgi:hypothetical protein
MEKTPVYVLVTLGFTESGDVRRTNMGVTFNLHEAEAFAGLDVSNEYETHGVDANWRDGAAISESVMLMRELVGTVEQDIERSLA